MTRASGSGGELVDRVRRYGTELHRLAVVLTGDTEAATRLTARVLGARWPDGRPDPDRLARDLVRDHLRAAPRRPEGPRPTGDDAGDVLRHLRPRARAASALRLVEGWDADRAAAALGTSRRRLEAAVPSVPGLDLVLTGLADRHSLAGAELERAVLAAASPGPAPAGGRGRRRTWLAAATAGLVLVGGYLLVGDPADREDDPVDDAGAVATDDQVDLTEAGWRLDDRGFPPWSATGLRLAQTVVLDVDRRSTEVTLPTPPSSSFAGFGVLWCDMPPAEDDHLVIPSGTLTVGGDRVELPCAGRDGSPPVTRVVALPPGGEGVLEVDGDVPGDGGAILAVYLEPDSYGAPAPRDGRAPAPPVDDGALLLDLSRARPSAYPGMRTVDAVSVGHDSAVRVWAGRTGSVSVRVDGVPVTDDGEVTATREMLAAWEEQVSHDDRAPMPELGDHVDWSSQQAGVRDGRWIVAVPDVVRTFPLPDHVRPPSGERRTVTVEVLTENVDGRLQVLLTGAQAVEVDTAPVAALPAPEAPLFVLGHRLVGQWVVPSDGHLRELVLDGATAPSDEAVVLMVQDAERSSWSSWGEGLVTRGGEDLPVWVHGDLGVLSQLLYSPFAQLPAGPGPLSAAAPPDPDRTPTAVLVYAPVPYEEFDFAGAPVQPDSWPAGSDPADHPSAASQLEGYETVAVAGPDDVGDGAVSVHVPPSRELALQVTTEGRGRMRVLFDGGPPEALRRSDGWWSSWTYQPVTSLVPIWHDFPRAGFELTVVVQDYEDFTIEVLTR